MAVKWIDGEPNVPGITDERLGQLLGRISPLVERDGKLFHIAPVDPRNIAFAWSPELRGEAAGLEELRKVRIDIHCGYVALVKPTLAEVLAQVPADLEERVTAFAVLLNDEHDGTEDEVECYSEGTGHRVTAVFYGRARAA